MHRELCCDSALCLRMSLRPGPTEMATKGTMRVLYASRMSILLLVLMCALCRASTGQETEPEPCPVDVDATVGRSIDQDDIDLSHGHAVDMGDSDDDVFLDMVANKKSSKKGCKTPLQIASQVDVKGLPVGLVGEVPDYVPKQALKMPKIKKYAISKEEEKAQAEVAQTEKKVEALKTEVKQLDRLNGVLLKKTKMSNKELLSHTTSAARQHRLDKEKAKRDALAKKRASRLVLQQGQSTSGRSHQEPGAAHRVHGEPAMKNLREPSKKEIKEEKKAEKKLDKKLKAQAKANGPDCDANGVCYPQGTLDVLAKLQRSPRKRFIFGTMVYSMYADKANAKKLATFLKREYNTIVPGVVTTWPLYEAHGLKGVTGALSHYPKDIPLKMHPLVWSNKAAVPARYCAPGKYFCWKPKSAAMTVLLPRKLKKYIQDMISTAKTFDWVAVDVLNEAVDKKGNLYKDVFWNAFGGNSYVMQVFRWAREAAQKAGKPNMRLMYNDYGLENGEEKDNPNWNKMKGVKDMLLANVRDEDGVLISGMGFQFHISTKSHPAIRKDSAGGYRMPGFKKALDFFSKHPALKHLVFHVSEFSVARGEGAEEEAKQAQLYQAALSECLAHERCEGFVLWGSQDTPRSAAARKNQQLYPYDSSNNQGELGASQPFDEQGLLKTAVQKALQNAVGVLR